MNWRRLTLTLRGPTGTPWQADTIFGHLCWAMRRRQGEDALTDLLDYYRQGMPPFLLSDGFPTGYLPRPLTFGGNPSEGPDGMARARQVRKMEYLKEDDFRRALQGEAFDPTPYEKQKLVRERAVLKNQISRLTGATGEEGRLFPFVEHWMPCVTIYLKIEDGFQGQVKELLDWLAETGYGKRKSVGYGAIHNVEWDEEWKGFPEVAGANAFVSLSLFVPAASDPTNGRWRTVVKYGRLGEDYALGEDPFKRPLVMLTAGSVLRDSPVRKFYGRMVPDVSAAYPQVVHYGYALPVPMRWPLDREEVL